MQELEMIMRLVDINNLSVSFPQHEGTVQAVRGVSWHLDVGESLGIVGESGSGKSVTCMALLRLLREPPAKITADRMGLAGENMLAADNRKLASMRGRVAAMVFQDPMTAFDPVFTIGHQIVETIQSHRDISKAKAKTEAASLLAKVEIKNPAAMLESYPHQLSGGMLQRAMIAMALSCRPQILVADEPTTALDVTIQAQILQLIKGLQKELGMGLIMITHDLGVIAETVDRVVVMYGGRVMEEGPVQAIFDTPAHPYTKSLLRSIPGQTPGRHRLIEISGGSPSPIHPPVGCPFHPRCETADTKCKEIPPFVSIAENRHAACWRLQ
jgi:oligopeptide/dipeptide ABC transporter ATP-binding protein